MGLLKLGKDIAKGGIDTRGLGRIRGIGWDHAKKPCLLFCHIPVRRLNRDLICCSGQTPHAIRGGKSMGKYKDPAVSRRDFIRKGAAVGAVATTLAAQDVKK